MPILEGQGVTKLFGGLAALVDVDFSVEKGEVLGLIGPNGAGKTTLFNVISAAFPPTSGQITFNGKKITGLKPSSDLPVGSVKDLPVGQDFCQPDFPSERCAGLFFSARGNRSRNITHPGWLASCWSSSACRNWRTRRPRI